MLRCLVALLALLFTGGIVLPVSYALSPELLGTVDNSWFLCPGTCSVGASAGTRGVTSGLNAGPGNFNDGGPSVAPELAVVCCVIGAGLSWSGGVPMMLPYLVRDVPVR